MGRPRKTTEDQKQLIGLIDLFARSQKGEAIDSLAETVDMNPNLLNSWMKEIEKIDRLLKSEEVHNEEKEIWKNMYLKVAYKLEQLENRNS